MSNLVVQPLVTELNQDIEITTSDRLHVGAFIINLYLHNSPAGTFTFSILNSDADVIFTKDFTSQDLKDSLSTTDDYLHTNYPIIPDDPVQLESGDFTLNLSSAGYTYTATSFIGWIQDFENLTNDLGYTASSDEENPLTFKLKIYKEGML